MQKKRPGLWRRSMLLLGGILLAVSSVAGGTVAFLTDTHPKTDNVFQPAKVTTSVEETLQGMTKSNVKIKNTGSTQAYIRAAVVVTWQNGAGEIHHRMPVAEEDYHITYDLETWQKGSDGFYYWPQPVEPQSATGVLIASCIPKGTAPEGYYLHVAVLGSGIQSQPAQAVCRAWWSVERVTQEGRLQLKEVGP